MLKSMRNDPKPQPPAAASAWMMPSDVALFGSVETSVFHGFGASKSRPASVVVVAGLVVVDVLDEVVEDDDVLVDVLAVLGAVDEDVDVAVELVVGGVVDVEVEVLDDDVELVLVDVGGRVVDVLVVEVEVVVGFFLRARAVSPHEQPAHGSPSVQSADVSHVSPAAASSRPSPQVDAAAVKD